MTCHSQLYTDAAMLAPVPTHPAYQIAAMLRRKRSGTKPDLDAIRKRLQKGKPPPGFVPPTQPLAPSRPRNVAQPPKPKPVPPPKPALPAGTILIDLDDAPVSRAAVQVTTPIKLDL